MYKSEKGLTREVIAEYTTRPGSLARPLPVPPPLPGPKAGLRCRATSYRGRPHCTLLDPLGSPDQGGGAFAGCSRGGKGSRPPPFHEVLGLYPTSHAFEQKERFVRRQRLRFVLEPLSGAVSRMFSFHNVSTDS